MSQGKSFLAGIGAQAASGAVSTMQNLFSNALGLTMSQSDAMERQFQYNNMLMNIQNKYQKEAAAQSQQYAKDYWDYTNAENQKQHIKNAGLNPALMYGMSGSGGMGATGGAKQESPAQPQGNPIAMGLQVQALEQQKKMQDAEIAKTYAEARKAEIEADKAAGVDTEKVLAEINERLALIEKHNSERDLNKAKEAFTNVEKEIADLEKEIKEWDRDYAGAVKNAELAELWATARKLSNEANYWYSMHEKTDTDTDYLKKTMDLRVERLTRELTLIEIEKRLKESGIEVNESIKKVNEKRADELVALAKKHESDAKAFVDSVNGQLKRWKSQTTNEEWGLTLKSIDTGLDAALKIAEVFYPKVKIRKKQVTNKKGEVIREELEVIEDQTKK